MGQENLGGFVEQFSLGNAAMGAKAPEESTSAIALADIAKQEFGQTAGIRQDLIGQSEAFLGGDFDVTQGPQFGALKQATEQQFDVARSRVMESAPEGGALLAALTDVEQGRAGTLTSGIGDLALQQQNQALQLASRGTATALTGFGGSAQIQAQQAAAQAQQNAGTKQGLGAMAGMFAASDERLKDDLKKIGEINGFNIYTWVWSSLAKSLGIDSPCIGVLAQEVRKVFPEAVVEHPDGYLMVNYGVLNA